MIGWIKRWLAQPRHACPSKLRAELEAEGIELLEERIAAEVIYRHYERRRASGRRAATSRRSPRSALTAEAARRSTARSNVHARRQARDR